MTVVNEVPTHISPTRPSVAVIGSGVSGLTAAYLLNRTHDVTLFEADDRLGGHAHTHDLTASDGSEHAVDSGFIVHNDRTYPWLRKLFAELDVEVRPTEMSMSVRCEDCGLTTEAATTEAVTATGPEAAQLRKIDGVLDYAGVGAGTRLLEIGTGWGALAIRTAQRGAQVTTVTISAEQLAFAAARVAEAGLSDRVDLRLQDYREVEGEYDAIVSVEMIEAVGEEYWPTYFATIDRLLAPGGKVSIQAITMAHERVLATKRSFSWIQKYIFPGGIIPSLQSIDESRAAHTTLRVTQRRELGQHYARTLHLWRERFNDQWPRIHQLGFDETFRRMWEFYLAYCEAGFRTGYLGVSQLQMTREPAWT